MEYVGTRILMMSLNKTTSTLEAGNRSFEETRSEFIYSQ